MTQERMKYRKIEKGYMEYLKKRHAMLRLVRLDYLFFHPTFHEKEIMKLILFPKSPIGQFMLNELNGSVYGGTGGGGGSAMRKR